MGVAKQVPLVVYKGGTRHVVGMAQVEPDGKIEAQVAKDHWDTVKEMMQPDIGEFSITPAPPTHKKHVYPPRPSPSAVRRAVRTRIETDAKQAPQV